MFVPPPPHTPVAVTAIAVGATLVLVLFILARALGVRRGGDVSAAGRAMPGVVAGMGTSLLVVALVALPIVMIYVGADHHLATSKSTAFCMSCHVMDDYGRSLMVDDTSFVPAAHYQNRWVPPDEACYTCHTTYAMFGDVQAKVSGVKHLLVNAFGTVPETLELYRPYSNRECLHCHRGSRSFGENEFHADDMEALVSDEVSCSECHDLYHEVGGLEGMDFWQEPPALRSIEPRP